MGREREKERKRKEREREGEGEKGGGREGNRYEPSHVACIRSSGGGDVPER